MNYSGMVGKKLLSALNKVLNRTQVYIHPFCADKVIDNDTGIHLKRL